MCHPIATVPADPRNITGNKAGKVMDGQMLEDTDCKPKHAMVDG